MINLTPNAVKQFKSNLSEQSANNAIYLTLKTTGCSGLSYKMDMVDKAKIHEVESLNIEGVDMLIDKKAVPYLQGTTIDYVKEGFNTSFKFINPNERDRCGCGSSFRVKV